MCFPYFDSPSVFSALLDEDARRFLIVPAIEEVRRKQLYLPVYLPETNVLLTRFLELDPAAVVAQAAAAEGEDETGTTTDEETETTTTVPEEDAAPQVPEGAVGPEAPSEEAAPPEPSAPEGETAP